MKEKKVKSISIIGAGGDIGSEIARAIVYANVLGTGDELQLVGREGGESEYLLYGLNEDLLDVNPDRALVITRALRPEDVRGDIIVMAASTPDPSHTDRLVPREELAEGNCKIFESYATALKESRSNPRAVLIVSNPVELGVQIFAEMIGNERVIGVGAWSDSKRLSREIASEFVGSKVNAIVGGEHGPYMLPLLSYTRINRKKLKPKEIERLCPFTLRHLRCEFSARERQLNDILRAQRQSIAHAFAAVAEMPAVMRVMLKSFLIYCSGAKTVAAAASTVIDFIRALSKSTQTNLAAQVIVDGIPIGVPVTVSSQGAWPRCSLEGGLPDGGRAWRLSGNECDALCWVRNRIDSSLLVTRLKVKLNRFLEMLPQHESSFTTFNKRATIILDTIAKSVECGDTPIKKVLELIELLRLCTSSLSDGATDVINLAEGYVERWGDATDVRVLNEPVETKVSLGQPESVKKTDSLAIGKSNYSCLHPRYEVLVCPPTFFHQNTVKFGINPYSIPGTAVDNEAVKTEFEAWVKQLESLSRESKIGCIESKERIVNVRFIEPGRDLALMVYAANGGVVLSCRDGRRIAFPANFTFPQRQGETEHYRRWFIDNGFEVIDIPNGLRQEGEGDLLPIPGTNLLIGAYGIRSDEDAYRWMERQARQRGCDIKIITIPSTSKDFFHLDTYAFFLGTAPHTGLQTAVVYPGGTTADGFDKIREVCEDIIEVSKEEALTFVCNSVVFHFHKLVIMPIENQRVRAELEKRGFEVQTAYVKEFFKAGGQAKCMVLFTDYVEKH